MLTKTKAIVLSNMKFKENTMLLRLYTEEFGRCDYLLFGAQSRKGGRKSAFIQPLSVVRIEAEHRNNRDLQTIKEIKPESPNNNILFNPYKNTLALFLSEVLIHILRTNEKDEPLFSFLSQSIQYLDLTEQSTANFHLAFLCQLTTFLGIQPNTEKREGYQYFDLKQAIFTDTPPFHKQYLTGKESETLHVLLRINYQNMHLYRFSREERAEILDHILEYYKLHTQGMGELKSLSVLKEIFD